jgi:biotin transport system substrate-specific component
LSGTIFITVAGQLTIPLPFTPVPLSLATFAVLLTGASLGSLRAGTSVLLYLALGLAGAPMFANHASGWAFASFGYILGYFPAALLVGHLARRRADRSVIATIGMACLGSLVIYSFGLPWLMAYLGVGFSTGLRLGVTPFLPGDFLKAIAAAVMLPTTWKLLKITSPGVHDLPPTE